LKKIVPILAILLALTIVGGAAFWLHQSTGRPPTDRPNVLLISIDTLRADHVHSYGYPIETTPRLDQLAAEGARFTRALSNSPWTLPAHVTMLTGQEVGVHNVRYSKNALADSALTITEVMKEQGYATFGVGSAPYLKARYGYAQGFDSYDDDLAQVSYKASHESVTAGKAVNKTLRAIKQRRGENWFGFLHIWDVHYDYIPPAPYDKKFADPDYDGNFRMLKWEKNKKFRVGMDPDDFAFVISQYDGEIAWVDSQLGRLFDRLKEMGLYENTAIIVTADHGEEFLDHGQKGHGHSLFDELVRVPMIIKAPNVPVGRVVDCPAGLVDLFMTIAGWSKAPHVAYKGPGKDLTAMIAGDACNTDRPLFAETKMSNIDKLNAYKRGYEMMVEIDGYKYHNRVTKPLRELLFNIHEDPLEQKSLLDQEPKRREDMQEAMRRHSQINDKMRRSKRMSNRTKLDKKTRHQLKELGYIQ
jgi:arylsulfatase A-like enzyme